MAKRSRRARRQQVEKKKRTAPVTATAEVTPVSVTPNDTAVSAKTVDPVQSASRKAVDFAQEYLYVYRELRNIFIIAILMFVVLVGLSFVI